MLKLLKPNDYLIGLDLNKKEMASPEFADYLNKKTLEPVFKCFESILEEMIKCCKPLLYAMVELFKLISLDLFKLSPKLIDLFPFSLAVLDIPLKYIFLF